MKREDILTRTIILELGRCSETHLTSHPSQPILRTPSTNHLLLLSCYNLSAWRDMSVCPVMPAPNEGIATDLLQRLTRTREKLLCNGHRRVAIQLNDVRGYMPAVSLAAVTAWTAMSL
jgi:hypothetical protein